MSAITLNFGGLWIPPPGSAVPLAFGPPPAPVLSATSAVVQVSLSTPSVQIYAQYNGQVSRPITAQEHLRWTSAIEHLLPTQSGWDSTASRRDPTDIAWDNTQSQWESCASLYRETLRCRTQDSVPWNLSLPRTTSVGDKTDALLPHHPESLLPWQTTATLASSTVSPFLWLVPLSRHSSLPWQLGSFLSHRWQSSFGRGRWQTRAWWIPWGVGRAPPWGESPWSPPAPAEPPAFQGSTALDFRCPASFLGLGWQPQLRLDFGSHPCPCGAIPILKVYFVSHTIEVVRLPGREPLPVKSLELAIDADSWAWGFSASMAYGALDMIAPTSDGPVEIEINLNGLVWIMLVENYETHRDFGQASLTIRGRSRVAYLAEPYAPKRSFTPSVPFTARQLAENELTRPGLVTGFSLDWRLPDWLVPPGSWSVQSLTPMGVIGRIVEAVGGYVNAHPRFNTLIAQSRYPTLPWEWANVPPDRTLPLDVVKTLNLRWQEKPAFNAVYASGERQGVTAQVLRAGTAGDVLAPMVVDALITHVDAARERGRTILADTGKQALVTLELPMLPAIGLLDPCLLIAVGEGNTPWRGLVRATRIAATWTESLSVRQTVEIERHYP